MKFKLLCIAFIATLIIPPKIMLGTGGQDLLRGSLTFVEDDVNDFKILIPHNVLQELRDTFERRNTNPDLEEAGFCFLPLVEFNPETSTPTEKHYTTIGFRVALTLWEVKRDSRGNVRPNKVILYTFDNIMDASMLNPSVTDFTNKEIVNLTARNAQITFDSTKIRTLDKITRETREFDLVFLDMISYDSLAKSNRYFDVGSPRDPDSIGITIERSYYTIDVKNSRTGTFETIGYRGLIFRPSQAPPLLEFDSEAAIAYEKGYECPPWWRDPPDPDETLLRMVEGSKIVQTRNPPPDELPFPWNIPWLRWLILILAILFILTLIIKPVRTSIFGLFKNG